MHKQANTAPDWDLSQIPLDSIEVSRVKTQEDLFYLVTAASFIESGADLYTGNLAGYFDGDDEVTDWLANRWQVEEMRHGRALRAYVCHVWPEFDWEKAFAAFFADYARQCIVDAFEPTRALELAARCVIETGTATFYQSLAAQTVEPVLVGIAARIRADEINHFKHFYRYFRAYCEREAPGRLRVMAAVGRRIGEARRGDGEYALRHAFAVRQPGMQGDRAAFRALNKRLGQQMKRHYPVEMAVKMLLKPLDLPPRFAHALQGPLARALSLALH